MSAKFNGITFETRLLARWAAFFDLAGWEWHANPAAIDNWKPDFKVTFPCGHSECGPTHTILISVLPIKSVEQLKGHPALQHTWEVSDELGITVADAGALLGLDPSVSYWEMAHGAGGGVDSIEFWEPDATKFWAKTETMVT